MPEKVSAAQADGVTLRTAFTDGMVFTDGRAKRVLDNTYFTRLDVHCKIIGQTS